MKVLIHRGGLDIGFAIINVLCYYNYNNFLSAFVCGICFCSGVYKLVDGAR
jgi:hypothetical protein